ncbi:MAG: 6-pyruvoyl trahydropterin synthase family protein [bacterium]
MRLFVEQLTVIDFSYLHADRGLVGESWSVDLELEGQPDDQGMLIDFGDIKRTFKQAIDERFDHKLLVPTLSRGVSIVEEGEQVVTRFPFADDDIIEHRAPAHAQTNVEVVAVTTETLASEVAAHLQPMLPGNVTGIHIKLAPESADTPYYHYSHGLKQHCGNCQRIAHGHRSRIRIYQDDQENDVLSRGWATRWQDIYIGSREDLVASESINDSPYLRFAYQANQGNFELLIPERCCELIDTDSTVEHIAQYIADELASNYPGHQFSVRAFEGIGKGAIGDAGASEGA